MELTEFNLKKYFKIEDISELKKSMFIEASAGTGKTYTITGIIKKLIEEGFDLEKILVVTYTEKAAGELRDRIRKACPEKDVDNAPIFTIHSFCQKTLSEFSFTADQCSSLSVIDDSAIDNFIERWIRDVLKKDSTFKQLFNNADKQSSFIDSIIDDFKPALKKYYLNNDGNEVDEIVSLDLENFTTYREISLSIDDFLKLSNPDRIEDLFIIPDFKENWDYLNSNLQAIKAVEFRNDILANITQNHIYAFTGSSFQKRWMGEEIKETFEYFKTIKDEFKSLLPQAEKLPYIKFLYSQIKELYLSWQQEKEKNKMQTYDDMIRNVREAVCSPSGQLKQQLQKKYQFAIIDEFQDTNQKQWDIFRTIFMEDSEHTIIVVGDPKQSIYSFQDADVNVYKNAIENIAENGGYAYSLSVNHRSTDAMVTACNHLFNNFFNPDSGNSFSPSIISRTKAPALYEGKETEPVWIAGSPEDGKGIKEKDFAKIIAQTIIDLCSYDKNGKTKLQVFDKNKKDKDGKCLELRNVSFHDFAILVRASTEYPEFERALKKAGIPFLRYKDKNLFAGKECYQWISLINAITAKNFTGHNRAILSEALFTDFFCVPLEAIENEKYDNPFCLERQLIIQWQKLAQERKWAKLLEKIFADTDIENRLSKLDQMQSLSKIRQIGNYAVDYLYKTDSSLDDLSKHLSRLSVKTATSIDEGELVEKGTDFDSVQLMTIHASKGLEFPVVIVPAGLKARMPSIPNVFLYHDENRKAKLNFSLYYGKNKYLQEEDYERERIYYVAYTRASSILILPVYDIWNPNESAAKAELHKFLKNNISELYNAKDEKGNEAFVKKIKDNGKSFSKLQEDIKPLLHDNSVSKADTSEEEQLDEIRMLTKRLPSLSLHKHSYSTLSHNKTTKEEMTENGGRLDKEGDTTKQASLAKFDCSENPVSFEIIKTKDAAPAPDNYPKGKKLGIAIHEVFEKTDFSAAEDEEGLGCLIRTCFEKQTLSIPQNDPDGWLAYTSSLLFNTLNAKLPEICGTRQTGKYFKLSELAAGDKISEAEFNMNADLSTSQAEQTLLKNYCNGFIDLIFKRKINDNDVFSILDWKSNSFEIEEFSDTLFLKTETDRLYSIQRVLYSYSLIKWLKFFFPDKTEEQIFEKHFGGIYYVYVRGCVAGSSSGIYARTWKNWQKLKNAYEIIFNKLIIKG